MLSSCAAKDLLALWRTFATEQHGAEPNYTDENGGTPRAFGVAAVQMSSVVLRPLRGFRGRLAPAQPATSSTR
jgi:hypothetical protein